MEEKNNEFTIRDIFDIIIPRIWIIALLSVVVAAVVGVYSTFMVKDTYSTSAQFYVYFEGSNSASDISRAQSLVPIYKEAYKSKSFGEILLINVQKTEYVKNNPKYENLTAKRLLAMLSFSQDTDLPIFDVIVTDYDQELAKTVANEIVALSVDLYESETGITSVDLPIHDLVPHKAKFTIYQSPSSDTLLPNDKNVTKNAIISGFATAVLSTLAVIVFSMFDVTIRDKKKLENGTNIPLLGVIPRSELSKTKQSDATGNYYRIKENGGEA